MKRLLQFLILLIPIMLTNAHAESVYWGDLLLTEVTDPAELQEERFRYKELRSFTDQEAQIDGGITQTYLLNDRVLVRVTNGDVMQLWIYNVDGTFLYGYQDATPNPSNKYKYVLCEDGSVLYLAARGHPYIQHFAKEVQGEQDITYYYTPYDVQKWRYDISERSEYSVLSTDNCCLKLIDPEGGVRTVFDFSARYAQYEARMAPQRLAAKIASIGLLIYTLVGVYFLIYRVRRKDEEENASIPSLLEKPWYRR